jgi:hypothetical protein
VDKFKKGFSMWWLFIKPIARLLENA